MDAAQFEVVDRVAAEDGAVVEVVQFRQLRGSADVYTVVQASYALSCCGTLRGKKRSAQRV